MSKKFGKYRVSIDKKGYPRYYDSAGNRVKNSVFEDYQREYLKKARKTGRESNKKVLRFPSKKGKKSGGVAMPKYLQRHFRHMLKKTDISIPEYQQIVNEMPKEDLIKIIKFVKDFGDTARFSEVDMNRLLAQIPALSNMGVDLYYIKKKVTSLKLQTIVTDRNNELFSMLDEMEFTGQVYDHIFRVSYPEGKFYVLAGDYLITSDGKFDGSDFKPFG